MPRLPYKLQLTKGFHVDFQQIARLLAFASTNRSSARIPADAFVENLGVSASRLENLSSLATALGLINPVILTPTELGTVVYNYDQFLDDLGTLWLLHYIVGSNERYVVWNRLVNQVIPENSESSTVLARPYFDDLNQYYSEQSMDKHIRKEISAVWNAYTEQSFRHLDYILRDSELIYIHGGRESISPQIFLATVLWFRQQYYQGGATVDIVAITKEENSPGRVLGINRRRAEDLLEKNKHLGLIYVETRADLDQVRFRDDLGVLDVLHRYYEGR